MSKVPRLQELYKKEIMQYMKKKFGYKNDLEVPRIEKIVVNMGIGEATTNPKILDDAAADLSIITGQKPIFTKAKKSISSFKLREGKAIGCKVTLRRERMYEFLDRLINFAMPRIRDFRGLDPNSFDGRGNYNFGVSEQTIFPEIKYEKVKNILGMDITIVTTAKTDEEGFELLKAFGMPFRS